MPNSPVPAAATGLPKINRRAALFGAGLAFMPAAALAAPIENTEIIDAGRKLAAVIEAASAASTRKADALAAYERLAPAVPKRLIATRWDRQLALADDERDAEGAKLFQPGGGVGRLPRGILRSELLILAIDEQGEDSPVGLYAADRVKPARDYERRVEKARADSGLDEALNAEYFARRDLEQLALAIAEMPVRTLEGLRIKALALSAYGSLGHEQRTAAPC